MQTRINNTTNYIIALSLMTALLTPSAIALSQVIPMFETIKLQEIAPPWESFTGSMELSKMANNASVTYSKRKAVTPSLSDNHRITSDKLSEKKWLEEQAYQGDENAQYQLAIAYHLGTYGKKDNDLSKQWLIKSANRGFVNAQFDLFRIYLSQAQTKEDIQEAMGYLKSAADQEHTESEFLLGKMFVNGLYMKKNIREGRYWLQRAAVKDYYPAIELLTKQKE